MIRTPQQTSELLLERAPWDAIASEYENRIPFDSPHERPDVLRRMVTEGRATLHQVLDRDREQIGILVTRVDVGTAGRELVIVAVCARGKSAVPISPQFAEAFDALARAEQCCTIRFHTMRHNLARLACEQYGYRITEIVLRRDVT